MNSELAALQEKLEDTVQKKEKIDQFLINSKGIFRQQVRVIYWRQAYDGDLSVFFETVVPDQARKCFNSNTYSLSSGGSF